MTEGLAVLAGVLLVALSLVVWRRYGWPGVLALWASAVALVSTVWASLRGGMYLPEAPTLDRETREKAAERAAEDRVRAEKAREAAVRIAADVDAAGDAEALVEHLVRRSEEG